SSSVFDAREENDLAVDRGGGGVEDGVHRIGPVGGGQNRVARMALEELAGAHARAGSGERLPTPARTPAASRRSAAWWKASADSAPSLSFSESLPSPSLHPPVAKSYSGFCRLLRPRNHSNARIARVPCSALRVTAKALSSASTSAAASSGCSSPGPGAGSPLRRPWCPG